MPACRALRICHPLVLLLPFLIAAGMMASPAGSTTLIRHGLESLTEQNEFAVYGRVLDLHSYWNAERTHILTDVRLKPAEFLKGAPSTQELKLTLVGGAVGNETTILIGSPTLVPGKEYVIFASHTDLLPEMAPVLTVPDHVQGVFDVVQPDPGASAHAVSQAVTHPLLPDAAGRTDAPGGESGLELKDMFSQIRELAAHGATETR